MILNSGLRSLLERPYQTQSSHILKCIQEARIQNFGSLKSAKHLGANGINQWHLAKYYLQ